MKQEIPLKQLYTASASFSIAAGLLMLGWIVAVQFNFLKSIHPLLLLSDILIASSIACIIFGICLINIWLTSHFNNKYKDNKKETRLRILLSYLLSSIPMIVGLQILELILYFIMDDIHAIYPEIQRDDDGPGFSDNEMVVTFFLFLLIVLSFNYIVRLLLKFIIANDAKRNLELENAQLKIKDIEATYQQLRMQIHPHFLFNSLSALNILIGDNPKSAKIFLKRLSDFLRTSLEFKNKNLVKVNEELKLCMDYLQLQKARFGEALQYKIDVPENTRTGFVPLFSIQQSLENAIKHNALRDDMPLLIKIEYDSGRIIVSNNIQIKKITEESAGIGLANLSERYKLLSGDEVIINTDNNQFSISIKVLNHEDSNH